MTSHQPPSRPVSSGSTRYSRPDAEAPAAPTGTPAGGAGEGSPYRTWATWEDTQQIPADGSVAGQGHHAGAPQGQPDYQASGPAQTPGPIDAPAAAPEAKKKLQFGVLPTLAMVTVAAIAAGSITGVVVGNRATPQQEVVNSLEAPSAGSAEKPAAPQGSVAQVAQSVLPSVVSIQVMTRTGGGEGSGSILSSDGLVLTNAHVVAGTEGGNGRIQVRLNDGSTHEGEFVAADKDTDIALVKIKGVQGLPAITLGNSEQVQVGQPVVAIGSPLGLTSTVTTGIVSALNRPVRASDGGGESSLIDAIQTDAAINPGNSGGPLVDMEGHLIGMNSGIASLSAGMQQGGSIGLGFAIPSNFAKRIAEQLQRTGKAQLPLLGVHVLRDDVPGGGANVPGAVINDVSPGGPAAAGGLRQGDVVTKLNERNIESADALIAAVRSHEFGETVTLEVIREGSNDPIRVEVTLSNG